MLCGAGPVVAWVDDAQHCDAASLTVLRRLVWASRDLTLVVLITARPFRFASSSRWSPGKQICASGCRQWIG